MAAPVASPERIGDLLLREGMITKAQLDQALQEQRQNGTRVGYNLVKMGFIQETELTKMLARQFRMPAVDLSKFEVDPRIAKLIPSDLATKHLVLPHLRARLRCYLPRRRDLGLHHRQRRVDPHPDSGQHRGQHPPPDPRRARYRRLRGQ